MYCSLCGAESNQNLRYCTRCGADLNPPESPPKANSPRGLVWVLAFGIAMMMGIPAGGIAIVFERIPVLLDKGLPLWFLTVLAVVSLMMISAATFWLSRLLAPVFKTYLESSEAVKERTRETGSRPRKEIDASPESLASVTEQTTRSFEPVPQERNTQ